MIITNSTPCMVAAAQMVRDIPVVFTVSFSPEQVGITEVFPNLTGAYDPFELVDFVQLIRSSVPSLEKIGIISNPAEPNARFASEKLKKECLEQNIQVEQVSVFSSNDVLQAAQSLAQKKVDAFAIAADNTVHLAFETLARVATTQKIPLFATDPIQVERGACAGLGIDYREWGWESGKIAAAIIRGEKPEQIPQKALQHKILYLNLKAAAEQNIVFPEDIIAKADKLIK